MGLKGTKIGPIITTWPQFASQPLKKIGRSDTENECLQEEVFLCQRVLDFL